jgi:HSP20 family protein
MANIMRWDPFGELSTLQDRLNDFFTQPAGFFPRPLSLFRGAEQELAAPGFMPPVDVFEDEHNIVVTAELPGIEEKDLDITVENNVLTFSGERKMEKEEKKENFQRIERRYGRFTRSFTLPPTVDAENVNAEFTNGVLKIMLPKLEEAKPKQIKIGIGKAIKPGKAA